jgi:predicted SAM-dependent methyltransferase
MLKVKRTSDGLAYLHIWREGEEYFRQKSDKFLKEWTNVMFVVVPQPPIENIFYVDLSKQPLDFPDDTFDAVDSYHLLEHLTPQEGENLVAEIFRVLKPGAIFRASVPDLESICREYLYYLDVASKEPTVQNIRRYRWTVLDVLDQMVREKSGGMMLDTIRAGDYDQDYLDEKYSDVYRPFFKYRIEGKSDALNLEKITLWQRVKTLTPMTFYEGLKWRIDAYLQRRVNSKQAALQHPRTTRENWRWMYDRLSLCQLMKKTGFVEVQQKDFKHSDIPHWSKYDLDRSNFADRAIDPSLYMEGAKPETSKS